MVLHRLEEIERLEPGTDLAVADFRVYGKGHDGDNVEALVHAVLSKSGCFAYGNQTCMGLYWNNGNFESYDTRYDKVTPENFPEFAGRVINNNTLDTINVELIQHN